MQIRVQLNENSYDVVIKSGVLKQAGNELDLKRKVLIVTDGGVPAAYAATVASFCDTAVTVTVDEGEGSKSIKVWEKLLGKMLEEQFTRSDAVVAVGGGVVGDLAGFAASAYMRGIDFYNIPTTLLSQVDSSVGGKTAVNFGGVKNIIGAFYQPKKVLIDPAVLQTLDPRQKAAGMAEVIKMALCFDEALFAFIENAAPYEDIESVIAKSIAIKAAVVEKDEKEAGLRRVLNFGHTIGHGIEAQGGLYHGECVALGMLPMCAPAVRERLEQVLEKYHLPLSCEADRAAVARAAVHDKKRAGESIHLVQVNRIGTYELVTMKIDDFLKEYFA